MLNLPMGHFTEATAVWCACVVLFVLAIFGRRLWIQRAKAQKMTARADAGVALETDEAQ